MQEFLRTVAEHYVQKAKAVSMETGEPASMPLTRYLFCFPNRRCGLFFSKYIHESLGASCFVPSITTISELFGLYSQRQVPDRTTLLFRLYNIYRSLIQRSDKEEFDQFVFWGDMLLSDFDDVDKYLVDADALFRNVKDLKDIEAEFAGFDAEIISVIQSFWHHFKPADCPDDAKREAFGQTWSILCDLYHTFRSDLAQDNLAYEGMLEREVIESIYDTDAEAADLVPLHGIDKIVFVGLTAISKADRKLMFKLKVHDLAEFCWDYADPRLRSHDTKTTSAAYFTAQNLSDFPNEIPDDVLSAGLFPESERQYSLYAVPSGVGQTQVARQLLEDWSSDIRLRPLRTAVVLPDEKLLIPMLYAVPGHLGTFNVTMGFGLKDTPIATFVTLLESLNDAMRNRPDTGVTFYYKPVLAVLAHSIVRTLAGAEAQDLIRKITTHNIYQVSIDEFQHSEFLSLLFRPLRSSADAINYLLSILAYLMQKAQTEIERSEKEKEEPSLFLPDAVGEEPTNAVPAFTVTDHEFLYHYNHTLEKLAAELREQRFSFTPKTLFLLLQKLIAGVSVPFSGEPLQGIQVMGVLETRGMDFDNVIILSMNEGVFPAKPVSNTFVPMSLRSAFGMPTQRHRDAVFAYHFYRLISRARRVAMIYDSRAEGTQSGEESRYIKQLRYLMGHSGLKPLSLRSDISVAKSQLFQVNKTPDIMLKLQSYLVPSGKFSLSATALNEYIKCPMSFYLSYVESLREDKEVTEGVDSIIFGVILHYALSHLYQKATGQRVEADMLRYYISHPEGEITRQVEAGFHEVMGLNQIDGYNLLISRILVRYVVETLRHDMQRCPFTYVSGEYEHRLVYSVSDQLQVRFKCVYDRLESDVNDPSHLHIIDYKTGSSSHGGKLFVKDIESCYKPDTKISHEAFQIMLYCIMFEHLGQADLKRLHLSSLPSRITPHLFFVRDFKAGTPTSTLLNMGKDEHKATLNIQDFTAYRQSMTDGLNALLSTIFNPEIPFTQCEDKRICKNCKFTSICKR